MQQQYQSRFVGVISSLLFCVGMSAQLVQAADYPTTFRIDTHETTHTVTLLGNSDSLGLSSTITLPDNAQWIQARAIKRNNISYVAVLYTTQATRTARLRLYHPSGKLIDTTRILHTKPNRTLASSGLTTTQRHGTNYLVIRAVTRSDDGNARHYRKILIDPQPNTAEVWEKVATSKKTIEPPADDKTGAKAALQQLNYYRLAVGLLPVKTDDTLSSQCSDHVRYMTLNDELTHIEEVDKPGYTSTGAAAGRQSNLAAGASNPKDAVELWMTSVYHRLPMLNPGLTRIGIAYDKDSGYACLHVGTVDETWDDFFLAPILFPAPDMTGIQPRFSAHEVPDPLERFSGRYPAGQIITITFPAGSTVTDGDVTLRDPDKTKIDGYLQLPDDESDPNTNAQGNTISFIPTEPLETTTTYQVTLTARVDGETITKQWGFKTGLK